MKIVFKIGFICLIILFFILFFSYKNGYYIDSNKERSILTDEMIKEYENDLKNGVDVSQKEYIVVSNSYDNEYTRASLQLSKKIENLIDGVIKYLFKKVSNEVLFIY